MKTVLITDGSRAWPNDPVGLSKGWVFNRGNCDIRIQRRPSGSVIIIWAGMIGNEVTGLFRVATERSADMFNSAIAW